MNKQVIDLTGKTFGKIKVIKREGINKHNKITWLCECFCGNEFISAGNELVRGTKKSCGCHSHKCKIIDITNKRFGKLTVISFFGVVGNLARWHLI